MGRAGEMIPLEDELAFQAGWLVLKDGASFAGRFVWPKSIVGYQIRDTVAEVVFSTAMSGYQETMTDPSYYGQMICFTTSHVGNYGITDSDDQSDRIHGAGLIGARYATVASNYQASKSLAGWLAESEVPLFIDVDTRRLTIHLRQNGAMPGVLTTRSPDQVRALLTHEMGTQGKDLVREVSVSEPVYAGPGHWAGSASRPKKSLGRLVIVDYGIKRAMLRSITPGWESITVPAGTSGEDVLALDPTAIFLSNGPGDPAALGWAVTEIRKWLGTVPTVGICLGHQLLASALGATTERLEFGHHGSNHPVKELRTGKVAITAQNHCYAVNAESLRDCPHPVEITHLNLFDGVVEGLRCDDLGVVSVQFHPEAAPGPTENYWTMSNTLIEITGGARATR